MFTETLPNGEKLTHLTADEWRNRVSDTDIIREIPRYTGELNKDVLIAGLACRPICDWIPYLMQNSHLR